MSLDKKKTPDEIRGDFPRKRLSRRELTQLKLRAEWLARQPGQNWVWVSAYESISLACDHLDSLIYRAQGMAREREDDEFTDDVDEVFG